jgi:hypothetical protein
LYSSLEDVSADGVFAFAKSIAVPRGLCKTPRYY